jgi:hypothetical protein
MEALSRRRKARIGTLGAIEFPDLAEGGLAGLGDRNFEADIRFGGASVEPEALVRDLPQQQAFTLCGANAAP